MLRCESLLLSGDYGMLNAARHAGYFTDGKVLSMADLEAVQGRAWEDVDH
jgi:hypothetical protein